MGGLTHGDRLSGQQAGRWVNPLIGIEWSCLSMSAACVLLGGMTLAVPGATGFVAPAQRAVIGMTVSPDRRSRATPGPQL
jgi:hypothetical protein